MYVHSEFGRRVPENTSLGTDHGTAQVNFVIGNAVKGGLYGTFPSLTAWCWATISRAQPTSARSTHLSSRNGRRRSTRCRTTFQDAALFRRAGSITAFRRNDGHSHGMVSGTGSLENESCATGPRGLERRPRRAPARARRLRGTPRKSKAGEAGLEPRCAHSCTTRTLPIRGCQPSSNGLLGPGPERFPESRPEATERAEKHGISMGVRVSPCGTVRWSRCPIASSTGCARALLETRRLGYWWANRMLTDDPSSRAEDGCCCGTVTLRPTRTRCAITAR